MDAVTAPNETPVTALDLRPMRQAGVPRDRNGQRPTDYQLDDQDVARDAHVLGQDRPQLSR
jgi:hypothetical protein